VDTAWFTSSYCAANECLETRWQKSSHSSSGGCVEARQDGVVQVRDSKDPDGPVLSVTPAGWVRFLASLRSE
jgi:hypothetical protein